jgi:predicted MPP superfamily phosphohydrolase
VEAEPARSYRPLNPLQRGIVALGRALNSALERLPTGPWLRSRLRDAVDVSRVDMPVRRGGPGLDGFRIAFLSDFHAGTFMDEGEIEALFRRAMDLEPEMICLGGDLVEDRPEEAAPYRRTLRLLSAPLGVFAVPGNHEYHGARTFRAFCEVFEGTGVRLLLNEGALVVRNGSPLWVAGVEDAAGRATNLPAALAGRPSGIPVLLLAHRPDAFLEASDLGVDVTLSGHTHGGQVTFFDWTPFRHSRHGWWRGAHERNGCRLYVGRGVGVTTLPIRLGVRGEIPLVTLTTEARGA